MGRQPGFSRSGHVNGGVVLLKPRVFRDGPQRCLSTSVVPPNPGSKIHKGKPVVNQNAKKENTQKNTFGKCSGYSSRPALYVTTGAACSADETSSTGKHIRLVGGGGQLGWTPDQHRFSIGTECHPNHQTSLALHLTVNVVRQISLVLPPPHTYWFVPKE